MKYHLLEKMGDLDSKRLIGRKFDDVEVRLQIEQGQYIRYCDSSRISTLSVGYARRLSTTSKARLGEMTEGRLYTS